MPEPDDTLMRQLRERGRLANGGGGSDDGGMLDTRVATLEVEPREIRATLGRIDITLRSMDERLCGIEKDVGELKGRVSQIPNVWQVLIGGASFIGIAFAAVRFGLR